MQANRQRVILEMEGACYEPEIERRVRRMLQLDLLIDQFHAYCSAHPGLTQITKYNQGRMLRFSTLHKDVLKAIATSNRTWAQTIAMTKQLVEHFEAPLSQDQQGRAFPTPQRIGTVSFEEPAAKTRME